MSRVFVYSWPSLTLSKSQFTCSDPKGLLYVTSAGTGEYMEESSELEHWYYKVEGYGTNGNATSFSGVVHLPTLSFIAGGFSCYNYAIRDWYKYISLTQDRLP